METALACLARLDAGKDSNVDSVAKVSADVAQQLGAHAGECEQLLRDGLQVSRDKMDAMQETLITNANSNAGMLAGKVDQQGALIVGKVDMHGEMLARIEKQLAEMALAQKDEKKDLEKVKNGVQGSMDSFEDLLEFAPHTSGEEFVKIYGGEAADFEAAERSVLGTGSFGTTYRMRVITGAKLVGVKPGQLFAVKQVASFIQYNRHLPLDFSSGPSQNLPGCQKSLLQVVRAHRKTLPRALRILSECRQAPRVCQDVLEKSVRQNDSLPGCVIRTVEPLQILKVKLREIKAGKSDVDREVDPGPSYPPPPCAPWS